MYISELPHQRTHAPGQPPLPQEGTHSTPLPPSANDACWRSSFRGLQALPGATPLSPTLRVVRRLFRTRCYLGCAFQAS